jgi:transposase
VARVSLGIPAHDSPTSPDAPSYEELHHDNAELRSLVAEQTEAIETLGLQIVELRARLGMNSRNSSKPPSSDGYAKPAPKSRRVRSGKKPGKQPGDPGKNLAQVPDPDEVVDHSPEFCAGCGDTLSDAPPVGVITRQVFDLPSICAVITEHRAERRRCHCGHETTAPFPSEATGPTCYGPNLRALVCYLVVRQHIPIKRVAELLRDTYGIPVSTGTIVAMVAEGASLLEDFLASLRDELTRADVVHADETGLRVAARLHWVHSLSNTLGTLYHLDRRRGVTAMDAMGVLGHMSGVLVHDGWSPYRSYDSLTHALCNAHHLRELDALGDVKGQRWAADMARLLSGTWQRVLDAKAVGTTSLSAGELTTLRASYDALITRGQRANPPPMVRVGKRGPMTRTKAANLLRRLDVYTDDVLRFADDFSVPFDNNEAERQVRMVKVQEKISGGFRSSAGATAWLALRSYLATVMKNGVNPLGALQQLMMADPWMLNPDSG